MFRFGVCVLLGFLAVPAAALAQSQPSSTTDQPAQPIPAIRRWVDVQQLVVASRFRRMETTDGRLTSNSLQWQPQLRARFLLDRHARYSVNVGVLGGTSFVSGWNNTGVGLGDYSGNVQVRHLFLAAAPARAWEAQFGSLALVHGENTDITSYDNDGFIEGERVSFRPSGGRVTDVSLTTGYLGDIRQPNVFHRLDRLGDWNYGQLLIGARLHARAAVSADYTYENDRDLLREGLTLQMPGKTPRVSALKLDLYQRVAPDTHAGFNVSGDLRPAPPLTLTVGIASIDRGYGGLNGDRYDVGRRVYSVGTYAWSSDVSVGYYWTEAVLNAGNVPIEHRWEIVVNLNPASMLKRHAVF